jgi:anaerobic selenocysteine-containing dehydrogenase/Fe-S-cluster-containing dehydrogenase component
MTKNTIASKLIKINSRFFKKNSSDTAEDNGAENGNFSRRDFLKIIGASTAATAVAGCADDKKQNIYPRVKTTDAHIPGVPVWFKSTCTECTAYCGIEVKTFDGRAIKIEGNKEHPVNKGSLCALGHSSLQSHYDPDRIREPLKRTTNAKGETVFEPVEWDEVFGKIGEYILKKEKQNYFLSQELNGTLRKYVEEISEKLPMNIVTYDALQPVDLILANKAVFGEEAIPLYDIERADVLLSFGVDFLETWDSPCEYAKAWSKKRRDEKSPLRFIHIEPRLSLTGANADEWILNKPGSELQVALFLIKELLTQGKTGGLTQEQLKKINALTKGIEASTVSLQSDIPREKLLLFVDALINAKTSLVLSGAASTQNEQSYFLSVCTNIINVLLGNIGTTVNFNIQKKGTSNPKALETLINELNKQNVNILFIHGTNPSFNFPSGFGFSFAAKKASLLISLSTHLDETAYLADYILPTSTSLEGFGDAMPRDGVYSLIQPAMLPLFNSKDLGDILLQVAYLGGYQKPRLAAEKNIEIKTFKDLIKLNWEELYRQKGWSNLLESDSYSQKGKNPSKPIQKSFKDFNEFWVYALANGGVFESIESTTRGRAFKLFDNFSFESFNEDIIAPLQFNEQMLKVGKDAITVYPFTSVKSFDGRAANRPWLQEIPDPITNIVWDAWVEMHPETAKRFGLKQGDLAILRNYLGEVKAPVYVTDFVHKDIVAVPLGQGHAHYGRFAKKVQGCNVFDLLVPKFSKQGGSVTLVSSKVDITKDKDPYTLVITSGSNSQEERDLARTRYITASAVASKKVANGVVVPFQTGEDLSSSAHHSNGNNSIHHEFNNHASSSKNEHGQGLYAENAHSESDAHSHDHEPKQMYVQREHPLYRWGMSIDLAACTGCNACVVACYAENNIPVVGKAQCHDGREMAWIRIERYYDEGPDEELKVSFLPMLCQHCNNAPCEPVCPVFATYHNDEGLNAMVYNRCVGTRYCSNNCSYKVRRFNWVDFEFPEPMNLQINPEVTKRTMGVMEKCTFCVQRIVDAKDAAKDEGRLVIDGEIQPACVQSCPTEALVFGNLNDKNSKVSKLHHADRSYKILDHHINTQPAISYLEDIRYKL